MRKPETKDVFLPEDRTAFYLVSPTDPSDVLLAKTWHWRWGFTKFVGTSAVTKDNEFEAVAFEEPLDQVTVPEFCIFRSASRSLSRLLPSYEYDELRVSHEDLYRGKRVQVIQLDHDEVEISRWPADSGRLHLFAKNPA